MENKTSKVFGFFKDIPGWAKGIIIIIIIILLALVIWKFVKAVKPKTDEEKDVGKDIDNASGQGQKPSYARAAYNGYADKIYTSGAGQHIGGTDEDSIYDVFRLMKNDLDILLLIQAFGKRRKGFSLDDADLGGYIGDEMNSSEIGKINTILAGKGIKYRL